MIVSEGDRGNLAHLHGLYGRSTMPKSYRDASQPAKLWKQPATPIATPSNPIRKETHGIYSIGKSSNGAAPRAPSGNQTAQRTLTGGNSNTIHPRKKQKTEHKGTSDYFTGGGFVKGRGTPGARGTSGPRPPTDLGADFIDLNSDDEDKGTVVPSTPDQINFLDSPASVKVLNNRKPAPAPFRKQQLIDVDNVDGITSYDPGAASGSRSVRDGDETKALERQLGRSLEEESDPIGEFSSPPPTALTAAPRSNVRTITQRFEQLGNGDAQRLEQQGKHIDLRMVQPERTSVKNKMKGKNPMQNPPPAQLRDAVATRPTNFVNSSTVAKRPGMKRYLWIKEWFLGTEHRWDEPACFVSWSEDRLMFVEEGRARNPLSFDVRSEAKSAQYVKEGDPLVFLFEAFKPLGKAYNLRNTDRYKMGIRCGKIVVKFDQEREDWSDKNYSTFLAWIKKNVNDTSVLGSSGADSVWEVATRDATRQAELADIATKRQKPSEAQSENGVSRPPKRPAPTEDDEMTPPPVGDLSRGPSSHHDISASSLRPASRTINYTATDVGSSVIPRRSARRRNSPMRQRSPTLDPDEVILCFPRGVPGAVNLTNGDFRRLQPGEFLNDTLIEFGLKLWLQRLEQSDPELARQVHVFSSFFYKKLNKKNADEGYESVRKWTTKIDLFSKKYIIVPINENFHWYLVIIYQPEHILIPPPLTASPVTRGRKNASNAPEPSAKPASTIYNAPSIATQLVSTEKPPSTTKPPSIKPSFSSKQPSTSQDDVAPSSEAEVEEVVMDMDGVDDLFGANCSITITDWDPTASSRATSVLEDVPKDRQEDTTVNPSSPTEMDFEDDQPSDVRREPSMTVSDYEQSAAQVAPAIYDVDMGDVPSASTSRLDADSFDVDNDDDRPGISASVGPHNFYGKSGKVRGKQRAIPNQAILHMDDPSTAVYDEAPEDESPTSSPHSETTTYIFTFDSLGSRHPQAIKQLSRYLKKEAQYKKERTDTSDAVGKQAQVPVQPNFCDCGLYLLHFAETFMSDPERYCQLIKARNQGAMNPTRQDDWKGERTGDMRERLSRDIKELSLEWKKERAAKEEAKRQEAAEETGTIEVIGSSDDEVDIVETSATPAPPETTKGGKGKQPRKVKAKRMRG